MGATDERGLGPLFRVRFVGVIFVGAFAVFAAVLTRELSWVFVAVMAAVALSVMLLRLRRTRQVTAAPAGAPPPRA